MVDRLEFRGRGMVFSAMLLILIVPFQLLMIPLYVMIVRGYLLGDTYLGMILPSAVNATAVFIFRQFFLQLPRELFESARLDGASELKILTRIAIPPAKPAILTAVILTFIGPWNEFLWPFLVTKQLDMQPLAVALASFIANVAARQANPFGAILAGAVMAPDPGDPREAWGVCNPACARGPDGELYLFPRLVAEGNYSPVGLARVRFDNGLPVGIERLGVALEPEELWERHRGGGGVEDPRVTFAPALGRWLMTYTCWGPLGPRIALAASADLERWDRLGPAGFAFEPGLRTDLNLYPNKDALLFPEPVPGPGGEPAFALLHRPMWDLSWANPAEGELPPPGLPDPRPGIWVSFAPAKEVLADPVRLTSLRDHRLVALPERPWEEAKLGGGTPPLRVDGGWLVLHHRVAGRLEAGRVDHQPAVRYSAGAMLLDPEDVTRVVAHSAEPLLEPELADEREGVVPNVVFPTAIDRRSEHEADVCYGMADARTGAFRLTMAPLPRSTARR
jgi:beta-1,2-mannobiose phosphorylase / 1,2-beta-oligomannan phosphorylase